MADYNNKGSVWKRQSKETDDSNKNYPQYTGNFTDASGVLKNVAMWVNTNKEKDNQPDINFTVTDKLEKK
jgi:hypothetical protein